ncbi:MAG: efflux RND transporter periplasmic adaptor subunit [Phycisphaerae bacterium]|nr:efflux RND transporter periplasmic adaptor subunit [Phycisphaerae bacterium]
MFVIVALACGGGGYFLFATPQGKEMMKKIRPQERKTEVRIEAVSRGDLVRVVSAPGNIEPKTRVQLGAQVSAKITALPFREGDTVKAGDVVVRLDSDDYVAALASAEAGLKQDLARLDGMRAELANLKVELDRVIALWETKDVSKSDFDAAQTRYIQQQAAVRAAEHSVEMAQASVTRAKKNLDFTTIRSPIDGIITKLNNEVGEQVLGTFNNIGTTIMEIADFSVMLMKARVDEANVAPVRVGQKATIYLNAYPDKKFTGEVDLVGLKRLTERDGTSYFEAQIIVKLGQGEELPKGDRLRSGYTANADIQVETFADVIRVPSQAVVDRRVDELPKAITEGNANIDTHKVFARIVYAVGEDGKTRAIPVSIGTSDVTHTIVVAGLAGGERIVTGPFKVLTNLRHDQTVAEEGASKKGGGTKSEVAGGTSGNGKS